MDAVREHAEEIRGALEKVKEPGVEVREADASRRRSRRPEATRWSERC
jgi:hypothetical protein